MLKEKNENLEIVALDLAGQLNDCTVKESHALAFLLQQHKREITDRELENLSAKELIL